MEDLIFTREEAKQIFDEGGCLVTALGMECPYTAQKCGKDGFEACINLYMKKIEEVKRGGAGNERANA